MEHDRVVTYRGKLGCSIYPLRAGADAPRTISAACGEVRTLERVDYVDLPEMAVIDDTPEVAA